MASVMLPYRVINKCLWNRWLRWHSCRACSGRQSTFPLSVTYCLREVMTSVATSPTGIRLNHSQPCEFVFLAPSDPRIRASLSSPEIETSKRNPSLFFGVVTRPSPSVYCLKTSAWDWRHDGKQARFIGGLATWEDEEGDIPLKRTSWGTQVWGNTFIGK